MKTMARNKVWIQYSLYLGKNDTVDANGNYTGEYAIEYAPPVPMQAYVSASRGDADLQMFGINTPYYKTMITDWMRCPIDEYTRVTIGNKEYVVTKVAKSLNHITYALDEVENGL